MGEISESARVDLEKELEGLRTAQKKNMYHYYLENVSEDAGFYYREADEDGLLAVYELGFEHGQKIDPLTPEEYATVVYHERVRQIEKGYDSEHDKKQGLHHILNHAIDYNRQGKTVEASAMIVAALERIKEMNDGKEEA